MKLFFNSVILSLVLVLTLSTCGTDQANNNESAAVPGVTDTEIVIGSWGPLTGPAALWGNVMKGIDARFDMINEAGGIHGRKIRFIMKDDGYDPSKTVPAVRELVQREEVFAVAGGIGTAPNMAVMDFLVENNVPWFCPMSGAAQMTVPPKDNIYSTFPLYYDEGRILAKMVVEELNSEKVGIIYQNDDFGKSGLVGVKSVLQEMNMDFVAALPVEATDTDLSSHVARLKESGAESVFLWTLPRQAAITLGSAAVIDYNPNWIASVVLSDIALMHDITKGAWEGVYFTYPIPKMYSELSDETIASYKAAFEKAYPDDRWNNFAFTGIALMSPFLEALEKAGPDLTREKVLDLIRNMSDFETELGQPVSFSATQHLGVNQLVVMRCVSATEAENVTGLMTGDSDVEALNQMLREE